ncbi:antibiotic biosynthesis monooxygenase family protein [Roseovarius sp. CH_XMU1461]|uniref:antibiotic biosynthesis monooxygenase family protein n=1 Tax=Roseovarius sp. CH_XMU1461 TaxID=3107777 RepID=UPI0030099A45
MAQDNGVIEIVTMNLAEGVSPEVFEPVDKAIEDEHVSQQPGFISRQAAFSDGKWAVVVNWESAEAAQASMDSFASAPAAEKFMSMIDATTMSMTRYDLAR